MTEDVIKETAARELCELNKHKEVPAALTNSREDKMHGQCGAMCERRALTFSNSMGSTRENPQEKI